MLNRSAGRATHVWPKSIQNQFINLFSSKKISCNERKSQCRRYSIGSICDQRKNKVCSSLCLLEKFFYLGNKTRPNPISLRNKLLEKFAHHSVLHSQLVELINWHFHAPKPCKQKPQTNGNSSTPSVKNFSLQQTQI